MIEKFENLDDNIYSKINQILSNLPANFSILEEEIDIDLQLEYYEFSRLHKDDLPKDEIIKRSDRLFNEQTSLFEKKLILCLLASIDEVIAYRTIEKFLQKADESLRAWAILALQESRMVLETNLLDENQVFISTGLGGKNHKLRYFVVLRYALPKNITETQKKLIKSEFEFFMIKIGCEIEEITHYRLFSTLKVLIPIQVPVNNVIGKVISECNQFGNFLNAKYIITNIKILTEEEIIQFLRKSSNKAKKKPVTKTK